MPSTISLHHGACLDVLKTLPDNSVDACVTDAPYGISFMGRKWDYDVPSVEVWSEVLRVLKPGGHLLCFAGTRTQHRMAVRIEDAGFEIRDMLAWVYGSGFPKSRNVAKDLDAMHGAPPLLSGRGPTIDRIALDYGGSTGKAKNGLKAEFDTHQPSTDAAKQWHGWGTALKPAYETVTLAVKPFPESAEQSKIESSLLQLEARLWLLSSARDAASSSWSSSPEYGAACAIARWTADDAINTWVALSEATDMSRFALAVDSSLSIVSSWRRTWAEVSALPSTSTTETASSTTTDWRTLRFSLSQITPADIIKACSRRGGFSVNASTAARHFNASLSLLHSIHTLSATAPAMSQAAIDSQAEGVKPNLELVVMARKPLIGTVAENVQQFGTGAINVDGCRVPGAPPSVPQPAGGSGSIYGFKNGVGRSGEMSRATARWPANLLHDGSDEVVGLFPQAGGGYGVVGPKGSRSGGVMGAPSDARAGQVCGYGDSGSAARFFASFPREPWCPWCAELRRNCKQDPPCRPTPIDAEDAQRFIYCPKASRADRDEGCEATTSSLLDTGKIIYDAAWVNAVLSRHLQPVEAASLLRATVGSTIQSSAGFVWSMCWCGSPSTDPFHPDIKSIIETETSSTTVSKTWKPSHQPHTNGCMAAACGVMVSGGNLADYVEFQSPLMSRIGTFPSKDGRFTEDADLVTSIVSWLRSEPVGGGRRVGVRNSHPT